MAERWTAAEERVLRHVPPGSDRDELLRLVRLGERFRAQQRGKRPGFLHRHLVGIVRRLGPAITFDQLVAELEVQAARGDGPIERASRAFGVLVYREPRRGARQITFGTLQNKLKNAKSSVAPKP